MLRLDDIRQIHLELTTACNARCPCCPRNVAGYDHNDGYPECNLTLAQIQSILKPEFLQQIKHIYISGNFGDFLMNNESIEILRYFREHARKGTNFMYISIGTNGGARDKTFWKEVATLANEVIFCIDGLEDTHSIYRKNTAFHVVIKNALTVIESKSRAKASWKFIVFDHNRHQIETAKQMSQDLGFEKFFLHDHGRNQTPVFDRHGNFEYHIGPNTTAEPIRIEWFLQNPTRMQVNAYEPAKKISCESLKKQEIYIAANGEVYPCCFMGHYPMTFQTNMDTWYGHTASQLRDMVRNNNALEHGLEKALSWFDDIPKRWEQSSWSDGRLIVCDTSCGDNNSYDGL